jgi:signal transduction histidine kinase
VVSIVIATVALKREIRTETAHLAMARNMRTAISQRTVLGMEFYIRGEERPLIQANRKTAELVSLLDEAGKSFKESEHSRMLSELVSANDSFVRLFEMYTASVHAGITAEPGIVPHSDYQKTLYIQVQVKSYILQAAVGGVESWHIRRVDIINSWISLFYSISLSILVLFVLVNGIWISKKMSTGVERLRAGAARLGAGDLAHRVPVIPDDEIADVARGINTVAESLAASFTSIRNLEHEVAQRERAEEEVRSINAELEERITLRTAELESVNKELQAFAYSVAHDLRAPLRSIDGFTKILLEEYGPAFDAEGRRLLGVIRDSNVKMDTLISNLLDLTKAGQSEITMSPLDMRTLAMESFHACADPAILEGFELDMGMLPEAVADRSMMERVWLNLFSNAVKYSMRSPMPKIEVRGFVEDGRIVYSIRDHGTGFDQKYVGKLFGVFQRLHGESEFPGSGIGLSIVKKIIERHGGSIWAKGEVGDGATFSFSLPTRS